MAADYVRLWPPKSQKANWMKHEHSYWDFCEVSLIVKETSQHRLLNPGRHKWNEIVQNWSLCTYTPECMVQCWPPLYLSLFLKATGDLMGNMYPTRSVQQSLEVRWIKRMLPGNQLNLRPSSNHCTLDTEDSIGRYLPHSFLVTILQGSWIPNFTKCNYQ